MESLTAARNACQAGTEPSDAIRVVNSVLTQLDQIKRSESKSLLFILEYLLMISPQKMYVTVFLNIYILMGGLLFKASQCGHPNNIQRDWEDRPGVCGQSRHQAVHRTSIRERHLQHLSVLSGRVDEGDKADCTGWCTLNEFMWWIN